MDRWERRLLLRREAAGRRPRAASISAPATSSAPAWGFAAGVRAETSTMTTVGGARGGAAGDVPSPNNGSVLDTKEKCVQHYQLVDVVPGGEYCNYTWDKVLCWPPTRANSTAQQFCPQKQSPDIDPTKMVSKRCGLDGRWEGHPDAVNASLPQGYTNYSVCFRKELQELVNKLLSGPASVEEKLDIATKTRTLEVVGLSVSLAALLISLAIFFYFRTLRNNRTKIHKNLFIAMLMQVLIRLTLYVDMGVAPPQPGFVHRTRVLCEASYVLLEYARTAMFLWMFIEGLYLHNMVTVTVFQEAFHYCLYTLIGWGVPAAMTAAWAVTTALQLDEECFRNYNLTVYFWILEGPRIGVIVLNFLFLLNIIRVVVVKLRQSRTSEIEQARKAVRAAVVLLPLLGITNLTHMMPPPLDRSAWELAVWFYVTHFLTSFQGLFIACLYCFLNGEVRLAVVQRVYRYLSLRQRHFQQRRNSVFSAVCVTAAEAQSGVDGAAAGAESSPTDTSGAPRVAQLLLCCRPSPPRPRPAGPAGPAAAPPAGPPARPPSRPPQGPLEARSPAETRV